MFLTRCRCFSLTVGRVEPRAPRQRPIGSGPRRPPAPPLRLSRLPAVPAKPGHQEGQAPRHPARLVSALEVLRGARAQLLAEPARGVRGCLPQDHHGSEDSGPKQRP